MKNRMVKYNGGVPESAKTRREEFARWIYEATREGGGIVSKLDAAKKISTLLGGVSVEAHQVASWIKAAREYLETHCECTLRNRHGVGWHATNDDETAVYGMQCVNKTMEWAYRTDRILAITKREHVRSAIRKVFYDSKGQIKAMKKNRQHYGPLYSKLMKQLRKEEEVGEDKRELKLIKAE